MPPKGLCPSARLRDSNRAETILMLCALCGSVVKQAFEQMNSTNSINIPPSFSIRIALLTLFILLAALLLYNSAILKMILAVLHREGSSHGVFVPFISAAFLWMKRGAIQKITPEYNYLGLLLLAIGLMFPIFGIGPHKIQALSFFVVVSGLVILFLGKEFFKEISFPFFFLITMIPIPTSVYLKLADFARDISFGGSSQLISFLGLTFWKEGFVIQLPNAVLEVNHGCSGIRYFVSYLVFSIAYAYLYRKNTWSRLLVVFSVFPISFLASILRLTSIFLLTYFISPKMSDYWPHVIISWIVFFCILLFSITLDQYFHSRYTSSKGRG
jgi:exosortase